MKTQLLLVATLGTSAFACPPHDNPTANTPAQRDVAASRAQAAKPDSKPPAAKRAEPAPKPAPKEPQQPARPNYLLM